MMHALPAAKPPRLDIVPRKPAKPTFVPAETTFKSQISECNRFKISQKDLTLQTIPGEFGADTLAAFQAQNSVLFKPQPSWQQALRTLANATDQYRTFLQATRKARALPVSFKDAYQHLGITGAQLHALVQAYGIEAMRSNHKKNQLSLFSAEAFETLKQIVALQAQGKSEKQIRKLIEEGDWE